MLKPFEYDDTKMEFDFYDMSVYHREDYIRYNDTWITDGALAVKYNHFANITFDKDRFVEFDLLESRVDRVSEWSNVDSAKIATIKGVYEDDLSDLKLLVLTTDDNMFGCFNPTPFQALLQNNFELKMSFRKDVPIVSLWDGEEFVALMSGMFLYERVKEELTDVLKEEK